ncbi:MAG: pyridoxal-phosphate dependent enzyme, partial [Planctomycetes bacterium]|nr:pyridoxal-phosphate dependent enzyme [Planctomycetota bacterium]
MITFADVRVAAERIRGHVHRTPVLTCQTLDHELGARVFAKCENLQKVGAFKARGACNAVFGLEAAAAARGVLTHSSGNHGAALAYAARKRGVPCLVVMPDSAPAVKVAAVRGYGAEVVLCNAAERDAVSARLQRERGMTLVHPFE